MIPLNALVLYKGKPAIVKEIEKEKYGISFADGSKLKVREKDFVFLHEGPVNNLNGFTTTCVASSQVREAWELLFDEEDADNAQFTIKDIAPIIFGDFTPFSAYMVYCIVQDGLFFKSASDDGTIERIKLRTKSEVEAEENKRSEKMREGQERTDFLERCRKNQLTKDDIANAMRYMQDAEALAFGKTNKSRTLKELKITETPENAHELLLKTGIWTNMINPHPYRFGIGLNSADFCPPPVPAEARHDLTHLEAFAIDSPWSCDPDDAVSIETGTEKTEEGEYILYVHVADPASSILPDSPCEKEARNRGSTLYLPEKTVRMLSEEALPMFALGLAEKSFALTFKLTINKNGEISGTDIFPSIVKVKRLTYEEADNQIESNKTLFALNELSTRIYKRRCSNGAVDIDLPDVYINIKNDTVNIQPYKKNISAILVRECMIAAGEGAGTWASEKGIPMPYLSQEAEVPQKVLNGYAGAMQLRKSMRPRVISTKPGRHQGMGLDIYIQVTSPLRRYTDLLAHMQIRAHLQGRTLLSAEEVSARFGYSEAGASACVQAERASDLHWKMVYLQDKKDSIWEAAAIEKKGNRWLVIIPSLALETQVALDKDVNPNDNVKLMLKSVNIPHGEAVFLHC